MLLKKIYHSECKDVLLNKKCSRQPINRIQSKNHRAGTYKTNKVFLSFFDDNLYILINGYNGLALGY